MDKYYKNLISVVQAVHNTIMPTVMTLTARDGISAERGNFDPLHTYPE